MVSFAHFVSHAQTGNAPSEEVRSAPSTTCDAAVPFGVSWPGWTADAYRNPEPWITRFERAGFKHVTLVPTYTYSGLNSIEVSTAPRLDDQVRTVQQLLQRGFAVTYKPHLDPPRYQPGFRIEEAGQGWRVMCPWRGFFDLDPLSSPYAEGILKAFLERMPAVFRQLSEAGHEPPPLRIELGSELMNSVVHRPDRWRQLGRAARGWVRQHRLQGHVLLSHNFSHHFAIIDDMLGRMTARERSELAAYIRGLDAVAISQYLDLTAAMNPSARRSGRLATKEEVAAALRLHEEHLVGHVLVGTLGLSPRRIPTLHIGEFGIGRGGLRHPNLWEGQVNPEERKRLCAEIAVGYEGLIQYLRGPHRFHTATLWITGRFYDVYGWLDRQHRLGRVVQILDNALCTE